MVDDYLHMLLGLLLLITDSTAFSSMPNRRRSTRRAASSSSAAPLFTIGVLADIQYAPIPDGHSFTGNPRYYRHSLDVARHAARHFQDDKVDLVLNLGDIVDGKCQSIESHGGDDLGEDPGPQCIQHVMDALNEYSHGPTLHAYGNHCLYNLDRPGLGRMLGIPFRQESCGEWVGYHSHTHGNFKFIMLDSYDVALLRRSKTSTKHQLASEILTRSNPNFPANGNSPEGLFGVQRRFVEFNGGVGKTQLDWLREELDEARQRQLKAVIISHQPIHPRSSHPVCLMWNYKDVLSVLRDFRDVVVASFSGHAHRGGYTLDDHGIHFRVFEAALENYPEKTYAIVDMYPDHLRVRGFGNCQSAVYKFRE